MLSQANREPEDANDFPGLDSAARTFNETFKVIHAWQEDHKVHREDKWMLARLWLNVLLGPRCYPLDLSEIRGFRVCPAKEVVQTALLILGTHQADTRIHLPQIRQMQDLVIRLETEAPPGEKENAHARST